MKKIKVLALACALAIAAIAVAPARHAEAATVISGWPALSGSLADGDLFVATDISDTSADAAGTTKKVTASQINDYVTGKFGANCDTWITTPSAANFASCLSDPTGLGALIGNVASATLATNATNIAATNTTAGAEYYIPFISGYTSANYALGVGSGFHINANTGLLTVPNINLAGVTGSSQCLQVDASGNVSGTGAICGTGGMVYPGVGIPNSTGSAWGTSYSASGTGTKLMTGSGSYTAGNALTTNAAGDVIDTGNAQVNAGTLTSGDLCYYDGTNVPCTVAKPSGTIVGTTDTQTLSGKTLTNPATTTQALTDGATISWNTNSGNVATVTLAGNRTMAAPTNLKTGGSYALQITQDATGSRTITWNSVFKWPGGTAPTLTTTAAAKDVVTCVSFDGTNLSCSSVADVK